MNIKKSEKLDLDFYDYFLIGRVYLLLEDYDKAIKKFEKGLEVTGDDDFQEWLAKAYEAKGEDQKAREVSEKIYPKEIDFFGINFKGMKNRAQVIILYDENNTSNNILETVCMRLYREINGCHSIILSIDFNKIEEEAFNWTDFEASLSKLELCFLIFKNINSEKFDKLITELNINPLFISLNSAIDVKELVQISKVMWGMLEFEEFKELDSSILLEEENTFSYFFSKYKKKYEELLREIEDEEPFNTYTSRNPYNPTGESELHYCMKVLVLKSIHENKKSSSNYKIYTESKIGNIIPDIYAEGLSDDGIIDCFEIETLFGQGFFPVKGIDETINKYQESGIENLKLHIILENFTFLLHLKDIMKKIPIYEGLYDFDIEFWTLDLSNKKLIKFDDFYKEIKDLHHSNKIPLFIENPSRSNIQFLIKDLID